MNFEEDKNLSILSTDEKRIELYSSWYDLFVVLKSIAQSKKPMMEAPSLDVLDGLKDPTLDQDEYLIEIYNNLDIIKELVADCFDEE
jgi:hypothetical protein